MTAPRVRTLAEIRADRTPPWPVPCDRCTTVALLTRWGHDLLCPLCAPPWTPTPRRRR